MSFDVTRVYDHLMQMIMSSSSDTEIDKAMADAAIRGAGYLRFTEAGAEHVPYDRVTVSEE